MKLIFPILASLIAFGLLSACSSKPAATEEQNVSVAPQNPEPTVTAPTTAASTEQAPTTEQKTESKTKVTKKKAKAKK